MNKFFITLSLLLTAFCFSQNIDLQTITKTNFKVSGGLNANSVYYHANTPSDRMPFTYLLSGNLNFSAFSFSLPLSYTLTNQGNNLNYTVPFNFNKLSLAPKYKWVKAYIGDANMTFSPYSLSGNPFRGFGVELTPKGSLKFSAMGGRLLKAVEANEGVGGTPVFERMGYGAKLDYEKDKYKIAFITFFAQDNIHSITSNYDAVGVKPQKNIVTQINFSTTFIKKLDFTIEYALSSLTKDIRGNSVTTSLINRILENKENTTHLRALKAGFAYTIGKSKVGMTYENVPPNYSTLGTLYINNDMENIGITFSRPFWKDKLTIATNLGYQRDDLNNQKDKNTKRMTGTININLKASEKFNIGGSYTNLTTYTNKNLDQFSTINNAYTTPADTLNYRQLSQNLTTNLSYNFGKDKNQSLNLNYNIAGQANEQGGIIRKGQASTIQNSSLSHAISFKESKISVNSSLNRTVNTVGNTNNISTGGSLGVARKFLKDKVKSNFGTSYNSTKNEGNSSSVLSFKLNCDYTAFKKHNFALGIIQMFRNTTKQNTQDLTLNVNYSYSF